MKNYLVVDLEGTCCDDESIPNDERETIEIGAVVVEGPKWEILGEFEKLIKPVRHPILTKFCRELTGISQSDVDVAKGFDESYDYFFDWKSTFDVMGICSWGRYDWDQLERDCLYHKRHSFQMKFGEHVNLSRLFTKKTGRKRGHRQAMKLLGIESKGEHHRGLSDARNIATMLPFLLGKI